ncbi:MAG: response regulator [Gammaproteobacteria bacterium]|nr:response regulator [Gammaproteobacteria bacterium]
MTNEMKTILLIDDDRQLREYMVELLTMNDYQVIEAENGDVGLEQFLKYQPDLVITDIVMPVVEGIEFILTARAKDPSTPFIAISGGNLGNANSYLNMAKKLGVNATLAKPFSADDMLKTIDDLLIQ